MSLNSEEVNILVYRYLEEAGELLSIIHNGTFSPKNSP
jgi:hypothetical protein